MEDTECASHESIPIQRIKIYASDIRRMGLFDLPIPNETKRVSLDQTPTSETYMSIRWMPVNMRRHIALRILILATVDIKTASIEREKKAISYKQSARKVSLSYKGDYKEVTWFES